MKLLTLIITLIAMSYAFDIYTPSPLQSFTPLPDENPTIISFSNGIIFDTRAGEPELPVKIRICSYNGPGYYLIQFNGPIYSHYLNQIKELGIDVVGYIPKYTLISYATAEQIALANLKPFVHWTGIFQPAYKLQDGIMENGGINRVTIQLFPNENAYLIANIIASLGFDIVEIIDHSLCKTIDAIVDLDRIDEIAKITGIQWIQLWNEPELFNTNCQWVVQTGHRTSVPADTAGRKVWYSGVRGQGTILSTSDTGIYTSHQQYYDAAYPINAPGIFPEHRKIVAYKLYSGAAFGDLAGASWHGTHVSCTVAGDDTTLGTSTHDGMAKHAKIYFVDIGSSTGGLVVSTNLTPLYDSVYLGRGLPYRVRQHSGSWGWNNSSGTYLTQDATTDAYIYRYPDFLNLYAAANSGPTARTIANPALSKNVITVGAVQNGTASNSIASFSSRGYSQDRRIKPTLMAPGQSINSAVGSANNAYAALSGTSMATPAANGAIGLIRQYLLAGYYPTGTANPLDSIKYQSSALLRAMAIVSCDPNVGSFVVPDSNIGWGRINVDSVLFFGGDVRKLIIKDDTIGVETGQSKTDSFRVVSSIPLRIAVTWVDTAAAPNASVTLVNDLNVTLTAPGGTTYYRGNQYSGGVSSPNPTTWDNRNVEECFRINNPPTGIWQLTIAGQNVPNAPMGFAYAITGDIQRLIGIEENTYSGKIKEDFVCNTIIKRILNLKITLNTQKLVKVQVYDLSGRLVKHLLNQKLAPGETEITEKINLPCGVYFVQFKTDDTIRFRKIILIH